MGAHRSKPVCFATICNEQRLRHIAAVCACSIIAIANGVCSADETAPSPAGGDIEVLYLDLNATEPAFAAAPCPKCLDEEATLDVAATYLEAMGQKYINLRVELLDGFGWRGGSELRADLVRMPLDSELDRLTELKYVGEEGISLDEAQASAPDHTWRVWYQTGWVDHERIKFMVDAGQLPLEALAWPPREVGDFFLIHARTGEVAWTDEDVLLHLGAVRLATDRRARHAATKHAQKLLDRSCP